MSTVRARALIFALAGITAALGACSSDIDVTNNDNGTCEQERKNKFLGLPYKTDRNFVNCDAVTK